MSNVKSWNRCHGMSVRDVCPQFCGDDALPTSVFNSDRWLKEKIEKWTTYSWLTAVIIWAVIVITGGCTWRSLLGERESTAGRFSGQDPLPLRWRMASGAETPMIPLHLSHTKLISLRLYFPSPFLPWLDTAQSLLIYSPTTAFALTLATLATLCKAFPCQKRSFLCSPPNPPASLPAALQPLWLPSPKIGNAVTEAMPDVKHISPDRKATSAVKAVGLAQDDPTLMVLNRYFSKITDIELGTWKGQMSMEAEIGQKPLRYPLWLDWSNSRAKWTESCQRSEWLCLQVMAREHMCLM